MGIPIIVVDDSPDVREIIRLILIKSGFGVVSEITGGISAVFEYTRWQPELIIIDIIMPLMNGVSIAKIIRKYDPKAKILLISSVISSKNSINMPFEEWCFLRKPFNIKTLLSTVQELIFQMN